MAVEVPEDRIESVKVLDLKETRLIVRAAEADIMPRIIKRQTSGVDASSGATFVALSIKTAVADALKKADCDASRRVG